MEVVHKIKTANKLAEQLAICITKSLPMFSVISF